MFCPSCGKQISPQSKFCRYCGTTIQEPEEQIRTVPESTRELEPTPVTIPVPAPAPVSVKMKFCEYCGAKLEPGVVCNCPEAVEERLSSASSPQPRSEQFHEIASASKRIASDVSQEVKMSFNAIVKKPIDMAATHSFSRVLSVILIAAEVLSKLWFVERLVKAFIFHSYMILGERAGYEVGSAGALLLDELEKFKYFENQDYITILIIMAAQSIFFTALIYFLPKLFKNAEFNATPDMALSTTAFSSVPWTAAALLSSLLLTFLSFESSSVYLMFAICGAALFASISFMDIGMKKYLPNDKQRLIILSAGYGIQLAGVVIALCSFLPEIVAKVVTQTL